MMRRSVLASLVGLIGAAAVPLGAAVRSTGRTGRKARRLFMLCLHGDDPPSGFAWTREELERNDAGMDLSPYVSECRFIPTGQWAVVTVPIEGDPMTDPMAIPEEFCSDRDSGGAFQLVPRHCVPLVSEEEAFRRVLEANGQRVGRRCREWAMAIEVGEPQGPELVCLDLFPGGEAGMYTASSHRPVRPARLQAAEAIG